MTEKFKQYWPNQSINPQKSNLNKAKNHFPIVNINFPFTILNYHNLIKSMKHNTTRHTPLIITFPFLFPSYLNMSKGGGEHCHKYLLSWLLHFKYPHTPCLSILWIYPPAVSCLKHFIIVAFSIALNEQINQPAGKMNNERIYPM